MWKLSQYLLITVLAVNLINISFGDELLSARCQSSCLHQLETRVKTDVERRKHLKHHIITLCKDDTQCSSCTEPCRKVFTDIGQCQAAACKDVDNKKSCEESCNFLQKIYVEKPGVCPLPQLFVPSDECTAVCQFDGDCSEAEKCCAVGCGRKCVSVKKQDIRLLPIPTGISVVERKRKRSAIIRWVMQKMSPNQILTNANLYVIQWRWSVHKDENKMTEWQTIMVKNKLYAIMKHLLSPGRYYQFRVAAVNYYGSRGFSNSSAIFKLSKEARAPGQPTNIVLGNMSQDSKGLWSQVISWKPPPSDLPIKNYVLSWQMSSVEEADGYENSIKKRPELTQQGKRSTMIYNDENEEDDGFVGPQRMSTVIPAYSTSTNIQALAPSSVFLVELHAIVDSSDGELRGERAITFVRTPDAGISDKNGTKGDSSISALSNGDTYQNENMPLLRVHIPYYDDGNLKTTIDWSRHPYCASQSYTYITKWRLTACQPFLNQEKTYYDLDSSGPHWASVKTKKCSAELDELNFSCYYEIEVKTLDKGDLVAQGGFKTNDCRETSSDQKVPCDTERLRCTTNTHYARCLWSFFATAISLNEAHEALIGFRIAITNIDTMKTNETILPASAYSIEFNNLSPDTTYNVIAQTITKLGIKETLRTTFKTNSFNVNGQAENQETNNENEDDKVKTGYEQIENRNNLEMETISVDRIIELPLESGTAMNVRWPIKPLYLMFMFWALRLRLC